MKPQAKDRDLRPNSKFHPKTESQGYFSQTNSTGTLSAETQIESLKAVAKDSHPAGTQAPAQEVQSQNSRATEVTVAIQTLWMKLQMASAYNPTEADPGRSSARIALIGLLEFLSVLFPDTPTLPIALQDLLQGLVDLDRGTVIPLLTPAETRGRPPNPLSDDLFRALAAAAMTTLMARPEMSRDLAARDIARRLSVMGYGKIQAVQVKKWREKMMTERAAENLAVQRYELALKWVEGKEPTEAVKFLLGDLPALYPANFPRRGAF
jgi:hypothetical protein